MGNRYHILKMLKGSSEEVGNPIRIQVAPLVPLLFDLLNPVNRINPLYLH